MVLPVHLKVLRQLLREGVDFVLIGLFAVNHYAPDASSTFFTQDCDILLPPDPDILGRAVRALLTHGYSLECGGEPLPRPDKLTLRRLVEHRALVRATKAEGLSIDLALEAAGFTFGEWRNGCRIFRVAGLNLPVGGISQLIRSKQLAGREKDRAFLKMYRAQTRASRRGRPRRHPRSGGASPPRLTR